MYGGGPSSTKLFGGHLQTKRSCMRVAREIDTCIADQYVALSALMLAMSQKQQREMCCSGLTAMCGPMQRLAAAAFSKPSINLP